MALASAAVVSAAAAAVTAAAAGHQAWGTPLAPRRALRLTTRGTDLTPPRGRGRTWGVRKRRREMHSSCIPDRRPRGAQVGYCVVRAWMGYRYGGIVPFPSRSWGDSAMRSASCPQTANLPPRKNCALWPVGCCTLCEAVGTADVAIWSANAGNQLIRQSSFSPSSRGAYTGQVSRLLDHFRNACYDRGITFRV